MFRLFFVMVTTVLVGLGSGYVLWGSRVARLTESLSALTLEQDTLRARLAAPQQAAPEEGAVKASDELRVINESIASFRQELADQKILLEKTASVAVPADAAQVSAELRTVRNELAACIADKQDLELRSRGGAAAAPAAPAYQPQAYQQPAYQQPTYQQPTYQQPRAAAPQARPAQQPKSADEFEDYEAPPER